MSVRGLVEQQPSTGQEGGKKSEVVFAPGCFRSDSFSEDVLWIGIDAGAGALYFG